MKKLFFWILMLSSFKAFSQLDSFELKQKSRRDWSPYGYNENKLSMTLKVNSISLGRASDYITQITYFDLNFVIQRIDMFIQEELGWAISGDPSMTKSMIMENYSERGVFMGAAKPKHISIRYSYFINHNGNEIIKRCLISGDWNMLVDFYVSYWPTTINLRPSKDKIAYSNLWQDKITLSPISVNGAGNISIFNSTIKDVPDYEIRLANSIKDSSANPFQNKH